MLESCIDQGESLRRMAPQAAWSVIAMVTRGDSDTELPLLWQICAVLQSFNYRITVLDASSTETDDNPGLQNLLDHAHWLEDVPSDTSPWHIVPARLGLGRIASQYSRGHRMPLQPLGHLFRNCDLVVVYADAHMLAALLPGSQVRPLLAVAPGRASIIGAYKSFKKLLLQAQLVPLIASVVSNPFKNAENLAKTTGRALQQCAQIHLGCHTEFMTVRTFPQQHKHWNDAHPLALRLMANAIPIAHSLADAGRAPSPTPFGYRAGAY
ncbi:hypothetical protein SAMN05216303_11246 [Rhodoferax sp. OV413]|uniref:hypothetical protein n=1 Tax=Rhodoferax sp. OV413 TaxID=1855285 RepID=UPI000886AA96|nr:hypothetical protein [Rhodoferax sp. OV413]SDP93439.1 hypothetical protein SAMN05216303_11246 [Rhodoferax sp. OV413]